MLTPWKESYDQPRQHIKSRDIILSTKVRLVKAMVFPVVMYGCESWTIKKAERQSIDAFELWCWSRLLRVPWTARRSNQSILMDISPSNEHLGLIFFTVQLFHPYMTTGKIIALTRRTFVDKIMSCFLICCLGWS